MEITLEPVEAGTLLILVHSGLPDPRAAEQHEHGWSRYLDRLVVAGRGDDPGPDGGP